MRRPSTQLKLLKSGASASPSVAERTPLGHGHAYDDIELVQAMRQGDESAAPALYDRLRPRVAATVARLVPRWNADAEDLVQMSMIAIMQSAASFRGDASLEAWASGITARTVYRYMRRHRLERRVFAAADTEELMPSTTPATESRDLLRRVRELIENLEPTKVYAFLLHDVCGFDLQEIASITGASVSAAQSRLVRGRREVHEAIGADPELASRFAASTKEEP
jgi:RNA polymerase sigma-70 factor (ECF subfamily)